MESLKIEVGEHIENTFMPYAMMTILDRALPDVRDGLKPVHRRTLYSMFKKGYTYNKDMVKCATIVADTMNIHFHGDSSIYDALALMTDRNETLLHPYINADGGFGKVYNTDNPAAYRYTYCRLNSFSEELFKGLDKGIVEFVEEGGFKQPIILPVSYPNLLIKPNNGISVGEACNFPSFNMNDVIDYTINYLAKSESCCIIPDFSTGGELLYNETEIVKLCETGRASIQIRSRYTFNENDNCIEIYEIPYSTTTTQIVDKIADIIKSNKYKDIVDVRDETGFDETLECDVLKIAIDIKKKADPNVVMAWLFKKTPLQSSFSANMNCLVDNRPKVLGVKSIVEEWIKFRKQCLRRELQYDISQLQSEQEKLQGLSIILDNLDKAISIIRSSKTEKEAMGKLKSHFSLSDAATDYISTIRMVNMNSEWLTSKISKLTEINKQLEVNLLNLESDTYYTNRIISDLEYVKKTYGQPRKTTIVYQDEVDSTQDILIPDETCTIVITKEGYIKKCSRISPSHKLKDGDSLILNQSCTTKHTILLFTSLGNVYKVFVHELQQTLPSNLGQYLYSMLDMEKDEKIISVQLTRGYKGSLINVFKNNRMAKVNMESFRTEQRRLSLKNAISIESPLLAQYIIEEDIDLLVQSSIGKILICNTSDFNTKNTKNVNGDSLIKSKNDSYIENVYLLSELDLSSFEDVEYYRGKRGATGKYLKKTDEIKINK